LVHVIPIGKSSAVEDSTAEVIFLPHFRGGRP